MSRVKLAAGLIIQEQAIFERLLVRMKETLAACEAGGKPSRVLVNLTEMKRLAIVGENLMKDLARLEVVEEPNEE